MIEGKFDVVFRGQIVKSFEMPTVKNNLVQLFKSSPEAVERLFSGAEVVIRKDLDYAQAMKYQSALKNAGALALIKEVEAAEPAHNSTAQSTADNQSAASASASPSATESATSAEQVDNDAGLTIAAPGTQIMPDKVFEKREVDTSELSLAAPGERIMPPKAPVEHPKPSIDHLSLDD